MTNKQPRPRRTEKREQHFTKKQRERLAVSKKIEKSEAGHDQFTGWEGRDRLRRRIGGDE